MMQYTGMCHPPQVDPHGCDAWGNVGEKTRPPRQPRERCHGWTGWLVAAFDATNSFLRRMRRLHLLAAFGEGGGGAAAAHPPAPSKRHPRGSDEPLVTTRLSMEAQYTAWPYAPCCLTYHHIGDGAEGGPERSALLERVARTVCVSDELCSEATRLGLVQLFMYKLHQLHRAAETGDEGAEAALDLFAAAVSACARCVCRPHEHMILRERSWWAHTGGGNAPNPPLPSPAARRTRAPTTSLWGCTRRWRARRWARRPRGPRHSRSTASAAPA